MSVPVPILRVLAARALEVLIGLGMLGVGSAAAQAPRPAAEALSVAHCVGDSDHDRVRAERLGALAGLVAGLPSGADMAAHALWLNERALLWAGRMAENGVRYRLQADGEWVADLQPLARAPAGVGHARYMGAGLWLALPAQPAARLREWLTQDLRLVALDARGQVRAHTRLQTAPLLDHLFARALNQALGAAVHTRGGAQTRFGLWAPTAQAVGLCLEAPDAPHDASPHFHAMKRDPASGVWSLRLPQDLDGHRYRFVVQVQVPGSGVLRQRVTDPYAATLSADSARSVVADLDRPAYRPDQWPHPQRPSALARRTDLSVYELHVRDFSWSDATVPPTDRGKYLAFTHLQSAGMQHLRALARAGLTDVHLMPVFDFSTVPEQGCAAQVDGAQVPPGTAPELASPDSTQPAAAVARVAERDCFNWGYDPWHFNAPEGSFSSRPDAPAARVRELRAAIAALHGIGLRVGMDLVFNHTSASGQARASVLDRIVPGYYHRRNARGEIERSTCCDNTATEHLMMDRLMRDSMVWWAKHYAIDSFRLDLMGHIPRAGVLRGQRAAERAVGRRIDVIGEGWDFGEVAGGARFVQAAQGPMVDTGVATFNDRLRDAVRGARPTGSWQELEAGVGWLQSAQRRLEPKAQAQLADEVRAGLAGSVGSYAMRLHDGRTQTLSQMRYGDAPWGYLRHPADGVNYVENHDDLGLFDLNALRLPASTLPEVRAQLQLVGLGIGLLAQGRAYLHAGVDLMRSKSMDRNSYDSGDWFNRIDWTATHNGFGLGLPPERDNAAWWPLMGERLRAADDIRPRAAHIDGVRRGLRDLLRIRMSSPLFRLETAAQVRRQLRLPLAAPTHNPAVVALWLAAPSGREEILALFSVADEAQRLHFPELGGSVWRLHPVLTSPQAGDPRVAKEASAEEDGRSFTLPARSVAVWLRTKQ